MSARALLHPHLSECRSSGSPKIGLMNVRSTNERWKKKKEAAEEGEQATRKLEIKVEALGAGGEMENRGNAIVLPERKGALFGK